MEVKRLKGKNTTNYLCKDILTTSCKKKGVGQGGLMWEERFISMGIVVLREAFLLFSEIRETSQSWKKETHSQQESTAVLGFLGISILMRA